MDMNNLKKEAVKHKKPSFNDLKNAAAKLHSNSAPVVSDTSNSAPVVSDTSNSAPVVSDTSNSAPDSVPTSSSVVSAPTSAPVVSDTPAKIYGFTRELYEYIKNNKGIITTEISQHFEKTNHYIGSYLHRLKKYGFVVKNEDKWYSTEKSI